VTDKFEQELRAETSRPFGMSTSRASIEGWFLREVLPLEAVLTSYFARHWGNRADIRDMMQDVYVRVCEAAYRDIPHPARPFIFTVARNVLIDKFRDRPVVPLETVGDLESLSTTDQPTPERVVIARDELRKLQTALDRLSPRHREALVLQKVEGLSRREIAQRMGVSEETVKTHLAAGLFALSDLYLNSDAEEFRGQR